MRDKASRCQHRVVRNRRASFDANGHPRVRREYAYCGRKQDLAVDHYGYAYCDQHRASGEYGFHAEDDVDLDAILRQMKEGER